MAGPAFAAVALVFSCPHFDSHNHSALFSHRCFSHSVPQLHTVLLPNSPAALRSSLQSATSSSQIHLSTFAPRHTLQRSAHYNITISRPHPVPPRPLAPLSQYSRLCTAAPVLFPNIYHFPSLVSPSCNVLVQAAQTETTRSDTYCVEPVCSGHSLLVSSRVCKRLRWSRGSVLAFGTQVRVFEPGRSRRIF